MRSQTPKWHTLRIEQTSDKPALPRLSLIHHFYASKQPSGENNTVLEQFRLLAGAGFPVQLVYKTTDEHLAKLSQRADAFYVTMTGHGHSPLRLVNDFDTDIVHVHNTFPSIGRLWISHSHLPVVVTFHNYRTICAAATLYRDDAVCFDCPTSGSQQAIAYGCYRSSKVASLPLAVSTRNSGRKNSLITSSDLRLVPRTLMQKLMSSFTGDSFNVAFQPTSWAPKPSRTHYIPTGKWLAAGRLTREKGLLELAQTWPDDLQLIIYGSGNLEDELTDLARSRSHCLEFRGLASSSSIRSALADVDGLVVPSRWPEGLPLLYAEALSQGVPVVANSVNAVAFEIAAQRTGATFSSRDSESLRRALDIILERYPYFSTNCTQAYQNHFTPDVWLDQMTIRYRRLVQQA